MQVADGDSWKSGPVGINLANDGDPVSTFADELDTPAPSLARPGIAYGSRVQPTHYANAELRACVRSCLLLEVCEEPRWQWTGRVAVEDFLAAVYRQRVTEIVATHATALGLPDEVARPLTQTRDSSRLLTMVLVADLLRVAAVLNEAGIPFLSIKGPALAVQTTNDYTARSGGDLDVLVQSQRVADAQAALVAAGWLNRAGYPRNPESWGWRHMLSTYYQLALDGSHTSIDLHWRLDPTRGALPIFDELWGRRPRDVRPGGCPHPENP